VPNSIAILRREPPPLTGASNADGIGRNRDSEPISSFSSCCHLLTSYDTSLVVSGSVDCGRRRNLYDKKPQRYAKDNRTAHLAACSDKSVAFVTNDKRLYSTFCTVEANYWQTQSIMRPLCDSRATCFISVRATWWLLIDRSDHFTCKTNLISIHLLHMFICLCDNWRCWPLCCLLSFQNCYFLYYFVLFLTLGCTE